MNLIFFAVVVIIAILSQGCAGNKCKESFETGYNMGYFKGSADVWAEIKTTLEKNKPVGR